MAAIVNDRDVQLQAASPRVYPIELPSNIGVPSNQVLAISITTTDAFWRVDSTGAVVNSTITLTAVLPDSFEAEYVTWSRTGSNSVPPVAGSTNTWTLYAADQPNETATYTATITNKGTIYTTSFTLNRLRDGLTGERGATGSAGTLTGYGKLYGIVSNSWSDDIASRVIYNMLTGEVATSGMTARDHLLLGDTVTLSNNSSFAETQFWTGYDWEPVGMVVDGNLLVNGTVSATKVTAGSIQTGQNSNAVITIGDTTWLGTVGSPYAIKSPFHVSKVSAAANQALITAQNNKDSSVAIWGSSVGQANGNAISGTWHNSQTDADNGRYQLIGLLGSDLYGGAVAGAAYGQDRAGAFYYFSGSDNTDPQTSLFSVGLASADWAVGIAGPLSLSTGSPVRLNGSDGTLGQVMVSQGAGATPIWQDAPSGGSVTYASVQTAVASATSALSVSANVRATAIVAPTSGEGIELAYGNAGAGNTGYIVSAARSGGTTAFRPLTFSASGFVFDGNGTANFVNVPTVTTSPLTSDNSTKLATTAYVVAKLAAFTAPAPTAAQVQSALASATAATTNSSTLRATGLTTSGLTGAGIELSYGTNGTTGGFITSYDRSASVTKPLTFIGSSYTFDAAGTAHFANTPTTLTQGVSTNNTTVATTAYVVSRIAQDAPTKTGSGASGTWNINISGNAGYASSAGSAPANGGNSSTVGGIRVVGGSGNIGTFSTGLSSIQGLSIICTDPYYAIVTGISGGTVTCICRDYNGSLGGAQGMRWIATGT